MSKDKRKSNNNFNIDKKLTTFQDKLALFHKHKVFLWLILFPPIGFYKLYKHKLVNKWIGGIIAILLALLIIVIADTVVNPTRIADQKITQVVNNYKNDNIDVGIVKYNNYLGSVDSKYVIYNVTTNKSVYLMYFSINDKNEFKLEGIFDLLSNEPFILQPQDINKKLENIYPQIQLFFENEDNKNNYGEIVELISSYDTYQIIKTTKGTYEINVKYDSVTKILKKSEDENIEDELLLSQTASLSLPKQVLKYINSKSETMHELKEVVDCSVYDNKVEYIIKNNYHNLFKIEYMDDQTIILYTN